MRRLILPLAAGLLVCLAASQASATANFVYHEQSNNFVAQPTCPSGGTDTACGRYLETTDRGASAGWQIYSPETYTLHFKVEFQFFTNAARVFYTTDGTTPTAQDNCVTTTFVQCNPTATGTTQTIDVATGPSVCTYQDQTLGCQVVDVLAAQIPPQPAGTTVKYIIAAWHTDGGEVVYANSAGPNCGDGIDDCGFYCHSGNNGGTSGCATVFEYSVEAPPATPLIISEFRLRGPGVDGVTPSSDDAFDEFIEIYNNSDADITVNSYDGSAGFAVVASDGITRFTIPNGTPIPARGHYLGVNSVGYSLGAYPASTAATSTPKTSPPEESDAVPIPGRGKKRGTKREPIAMKREPPAPKSRTPSAATAEGDTTYTTDIADNVGIALFNTSDPLNFTEDRRLDAVGSTSEMNTLYKEGAGYPAIIPSSVNYSFYRDTCGKGGSITTFGTCPTSTPVDTGSNATDFVFVDPSGTDSGAGGRLGAPGPENSTSPVQRNAFFIGTLYATCVASSAVPNRERDGTSDPANNSPHGTLAIRRRIINNTGQDVTRLRFRVIDISTYPAPSGTAQLIVRSSSTTLVPSHPCTGLPTTLYGTTLEQPPDQPNGGGFNSSLSVTAITSITPLAADDNPATIGVVENAVDVEFLLGIVEPGRFKFYVNIEALP